MKHVVARTSITSMLSRLKEAYARHPVFKHARLPFFCSAALAALTLLTAGGGGIYFVAGALATLGCIGWCLHRTSRTLRDLIQTYQVSA